MIKKHIIHILFILVSLLLVITWFHSGSIIALGESGIPFYNLGKLFNFYTYTWSPLSLGFFPGGNAGSIPFFGPALFLYFLRIPGFVIQAIVFFVLILALLEGALHFFTLVFPKNIAKSFIFQLIAPLFYLFNLVSLVSAFNRVEYPFLLFYVFIPILLYLFTKGLIKKDFRYVIIVNFACIPFSLALTAIPFFLLTWIILGFYTVFWIAVNFHKKRDVVFPIVLFAGIVFLWLIFESWWFLQFLEWALFGTHGTNTLQGNIDTLKALSDTQGDLSFVFRLMNKIFFTQIANVWGPVYQSAPFTLLSFAIPVLAFVPLIMKKKPVIVYFFLILAVLAVFFTKGSAQPFGWILIFLFSQSNAAETFRSAFEKFGLVIPFAYAPLIGYSSWLLFEYAKKKFGKKVTAWSLVVFCVLFFGVLTFPYWNGWIFTYPVARASELSVGDYVQIPSYYDQMDTYLSSHVGDSRTYMLPSQTDSVTYTWAHSFTGVDYSNGIFSTPILSLNLAGDGSGFIMNQLQYTFDTNPNYFVNVLDMTHTRYVMVRSDIAFKLVGMRNPKTVLAQIMHTVFSNMALVKKIGQLTLFRFPSTLPKIYPVGQVYTANKDVTFSDVFQLVPFAPNSGIFDVNNGTGLDNILYNKSGAEVIEPTFLIDYSNYPVNDLLTAQQHIPYVRYVPGSKLYPLISLKERFVDAFTVSPEGKYFEYIDLSNKRTAELQTVVQNNDNRDTQIAIQNYLLDINRFLPYLQTGLLNIYTENINYFRYEMISERIILSHLEQTTSNRSIRNQLQHCLTVFDKLMAQLDVTTLYPSLLPMGSQRMAYRFFVPNNGIYQLVVNNMQLKSTSVPNDTWHAQVDSDLLSQTPIGIHNFVSLGSTYLKKGLHEVQLAVPEAVNLFPSTQQSASYSFNTMKTITIPFTNVDRYSSYKLTFDYKLNALDGVDVQVNSDIDEVKNGQSNTFSQVSLDSTNGKWMTKQFTFTPENAESREVISFVIHPENICELVNQSDPNLLSKCSDPRFRAKYNGIVNFMYKNIKLERLFTNTVYLMKHNPTPVLPAPEITYTTKNASKYIVHVKNAKNPFFLIFAETFEPRWEAILPDNTSIPTSNHFLANSYANAWYVTKTGSYNITLAFSPENTYVLGIIISIVSMVTGGVLLFVLRKRK